MRIYRHGYYYPWTDKEKTIFSGKIHREPDHIQAVVDDAIKWGFFDKKLYEKYQVLTSAGIQKRYLEATKRRDEIIMYTLILLTDINAYKNVILVDNNPVNVNGGTQSKVKESKGKESKVKDKDIQTVCENVLKHMNEITGRRFKTVDNGMVARIKEGHTETDMKLVIEDRWAKWQGTEYEQYVRPSTLFRPSHFEEYLAEARKHEKKPAPACPKCGKSLANEIKNRSSHCYNPECDADIRGVYEKA